MRDKGGHRKRGLVGGFHSRVMFQFVDKYSRATYSPFSNTHNLSCIMTQNGLVLLHRHITKLNCGALTGGAGFGDESAHYALLGIEIFVSLFDTSTREI